MPTLKLDSGAGKELEKLSKRDPKIKERFEKTKKAFDQDHKSPNLEFKKHKSLDGVFKIVLLGRDDGKRLMLRPDSTKQTFYVYAILKHDDI